MEEELKNLHPSLQIIRAIVYSLSLNFVLLILVNTNYLLQENLYGSIAFFGVLLVGLEAFFTSRYLNLHIQTQNKHKNYELTHHLLNHSFYPVIAYLAICLFLLVENNISLSYGIIIINLFMTSLYLYFLPYHVLFNHKDHLPTKYSSLKIDLINFIFKFFSFYIVVLTIYTFYSQSRITIYYLVTSLLMLTFLYLFFHIFRKHEYKSFLNIFIALIFTVIYTFFSVTLNTNNPNVNAMISTLFFYLTSAIYYHKVDGNLSYKTLIEYGAIGLMVSIIIFSIR